MSGDSSSRNPSFIRRNPVDQCKSPPVHSETDYPSSLLESGHALGYQQGAFPTPASAWPFNSPRSTLGNDSHSTHSFQVPLHHQNSATSLSPGTSLAGSVLDPNPPLPEQSAQPTSNSVDCEERLAESEARGLEITLFPGPMSVAAGGYLAGPMQPNSHQYVWGNRPFQPLQPPSRDMNPQYPPSQPYTSSQFPVGYNGNPSGQIPDYHESSGPPSYLPGAPSNAQQNQSRSPPMARPFPHSGGALPNQPLMASSPPYMMSQPDYYLPESPPIQPSHQSSMSPQSSSMLTEPVFAASDSMPPATGSDHQVRVVSSRPRPQCWDHGCNGREFSTFSNLLRHQREKSGVVAKAECPVCGAVFTRTTARNIHVAQGKCKGPGQEPSAE